MDEWKEERIQAKYKYFDEFGDYLNGKRPKPSQDNLYKYDYDAEDINKIERAALMFAAHR